MCLMRGWPPFSSDRAAGGCPRAPIATPVAPRATIDSHSRRPVVFAMLNGSSGLEARGSRRDALVHRAAGGRTELVDGVRHEELLRDSPAHSNLNTSHRLRDLDSPHHTAGPPPSA